MIKSVELDLTLIKGAGFDVMEPYSRYYGGLVNRLGV